MNIKEKIQENIRNCPIIIKLIFFVILILMLFYSYKSEGAKDIKLDKLENKLLNSKSLEGMEKATDRQLLEFFGLDYNGFDSYLYYRDNTALSVTEFLLIKLKSTSQAQSVEEAINKRVAEQTKAFEGYGPKQVSTLKESIIIVKGKLVFYACGPKADKIREVFSDAI